jgi:hypothetical protein
MKQEQFQSLAITHNAMCASTAPATPSSDSLAASVALRKHIEEICEELGADVTRQVEMLDEAALQRLLIARNNNVQHAAKLGLQCCKWRAAMRPDQLRSSDVPVAFSQGTWRFMGFSKAGMPVILVRVCLWDPAKYTVEEYSKYVAYFMEQNIKRAERRLKQEQQKEGVQDTLPSVRNFIIFDFKGMSYLRSDLIKLKQLAQITSTYYPERLGVACCINTDWVFRATWKVVRGWVDDRTASKAQIFSNNYQPFLFQEIGKDQLPEDLGGTHTDWPVCEPHEHPEL